MTNAIVSFLSLFIGFSVLIMTATPAGAQERTSVPPVTTPVSETHLHVFESDVAEPVVRREFKNIVIETKAGSAFEFPSLPKEAELLEIFNKMTPEQQDAFQKNRALFLAKAAAVLSNTKLVFGFGSLVKGKMQQVYRAIQIQEQFPDPLPQKLPPSPISTIAEAMTGTTPEPMTNRPNLTDRSYQVIQSMLKGIDNRLWTQSPLVAVQNEFAVVASVGVIAEGGVGQRGLGGSLGIGVSFGYNKTEKAFVFEIYRETDAFKRALTPTFMVGLSPRVGFSILEQQGGREMLPKVGHTFYPPGAPGYATTTSDMFTAGMNSSLFAFPPLVGDAMSYTNRITRTTMLRITVSPVVKGFVRVAFGGLPVPSRAGIQGVGNALKELGYFVRSRLTRSCRNVFAS